MARIRTIKPEFFRSPDTAHATAVARLLFIAMWSWADDFGRGEADLKALEGFAFPNDDIAELSGGISENFRQVLAEVVECYGLDLYVVGGRPYYAIPSWRRHQRNEKSAQAKYPGPEDGVTCTVDEIGGSLRKFRRTTADDPRTSGPGTGEQGNRGTGEQSSSSEPDGSDPDDHREDVEKVCQHLKDRIVGNGCKEPTITKAWRTSARLLIDRDKRTVSQIITAIDWCQDDEFWRGNILSMPKLREKYDQLRLAAQKSKPPAKPERLTFGGGDRPSWEM